MVEMFKKSKFFLAVAQKMIYEEGISFTESNIVSYLAEVEEYICALITYNAFKRDDPNAAIAAIPLENLTVKDHNTKNALSIKDQTSEIIASMLQENGSLAEEYLECTDVKQLYANFQKLVSLHETMGKDV